MVVRHCLKCEVCGSITLLRTQLGWLEFHPIRVHCGKCGVLISGAAFLNPHEGTFHFEFQNVDAINDVKPDFCIEASGELLTAKLTTYEGTSIPIAPTPFIRSWGVMGDKNYETFSKRVIQFLRLSKEEWPKVRRVNELWLSGKHEFLASEVGKFLPKDKFPMDNELEFLRGVHQLNFIFLWPIFDDKRFSTTTEFLWGEIGTFAQRDVRGLIKLVQYFTESGVLMRYETKVFSCMNQFVEKFQYLIPVFGLQFYESIPPNLSEMMGITTASFEDLKQSYIDTYEVAAEILSLIVAFNNLKYRGEYDSMASRRRDVRTLTDFESKSKGERIQFLDGAEDFDQLLHNRLNIQLRNAIGHNTYHFDGVTQALTYFPNGKEDMSKANTMFLLDFLRSCWLLFHSLIIEVAELIYQTRKVHYVSQGLTSVDPSVFTRGNGNG